MIRQAHQVENSCIVLNTAPTMKRYGYYTFGISMWVYFLVGCHDFHGKTIRLNGRFSCWCCING